MPIPITAGATVYAKDIKRVSRFYEQVMQLALVHEEEDYIILESQAFQLVVVAIPAHIAAEIQIASPPARREDAAVKLVFVVPGICAARATAAKLGGELNGVEREWQFQSYRVCDGHDPEGNVIQLREKIR